MTPAEYIGGRIAFLRSQRGLTQRQLAEKVGTSRENLGGVERGTRGAQRLDTLVRYARALEVTVAALVEGLEDAITTTDSEKQR